MESPGYLPLHADRWTPMVRTLTFKGIDLTGATFAAQVRLTPDTPGTPLVNLTTTGTVGAEGLRLMSAGLVNNVMTSVVYMRINEATMESLPPADEIGNDLVLAWDLHITVNGLKERYLYGPFTVRAGVTQ